MVTGGGDKPEVCCGRYSLRGLREPLSYEDITSKQRQGQRDGDYRLDWGERHTQAHTQTRKSRQPFCAPQCANAAGS